MCVFLFCISLVGLNKMYLIALFWDFAMNTTRTCNLCFLYCNLNVPTTRLQRIQSCSLVGFLISMQPVVLGVDTDFLLALGEDCTETERGKEATSFLLTVLLKGNHKITYHELMTS